MTNEGLKKKYPIQDDTWPSRRWNKEMTDYIDLSGHEDYTDRMEEFKWELPKQKERPVGDGDLRIVNLPVKVIFEWCDKIVADYDSETDTILEYTSGYVMKVLPEQSFVYRDEKTTFIASTFREAEK